MMTWTARGSKEALSMASMRWEEDQVGSGGGKCRLYSAMLLWDEMWFAAPWGLRWRPPWWVHKTLLEKRCSQGTALGSAASAPRAAS